MGLTQSAKPSGEPVTLEQFKGHARIDGDDANEGALRQLRGATEEVQRLTALQLLNATWVYTFDAFPIDAGGRIWMPKAPLSSVSSITYLDSDGDSQTVAASVYQLVTSETPGSVVLQYGQTWPTARTDTEAVTVTFVAGYGTDQAQVPDMAQNAVLALATYRWWNPGAADIPDDVMSAIRQLQVYPREPVLNG
tara:strand:- start:4378 stop:4959 length:582 start_codon:yes stop_codon:yes gene_type:complete